MKLPGWWCGNGYRSIELLFPLTPPAFRLTAFILAPSSLFWLLFLLELAGEVGYNQATFDVGRTEPYKAPAGGVTPRSVTPC